MARSSNAKAEIARARVFGLAVLCLLAGLALGRSIAASDQIEHFKLQSSEGKSFDSRKELAGKIGVIAFCRADQAYSEHVLYDLRDLSKHLESESVRVVSVFSGSGEAAELEGLRKRLLLDFPILLDPDWTVYGSFGVVVRPTVWIVDQQGERKFEIAGYHRDLQTQVEADADFLRGKIDEEELAQRKQPARAPSFAGTAGPSVRYKLARRLIATGKREAAKRQLELAWAEKPPFALAGVELARILIEEGNDAEARPILDKALQLAPSEPLALGTKGLAVLKQGKKDEALDLLRQAIENGATEPFFFYELGRILEQRGEAGEACGYFRRGFELLLERLNKKEE